MMWGLLSLLGCQLYHIVNSQNCNGGFSCESNGVYFWQHWLKNTSSQVVSWLSIKQVQTAVFKIDLFLICLTFLLWSGVKSSQFWDQLCGIFGSVDWQSFGNDVKSLTEFSNGDLLLSAESSAVLVKVDAQSDINSSSTSNNLSWLQSSFGNANWIV